jgi:diacylglycerol kinase family enzyme
MGVGRFRKVEVVANVASGSVGKDAAAVAEKIFADHGIDAHICAPPTGELDACLRAAVDAAPDLLVIIAGDGTARAAAELCGPDGPVLAPLPGGTMNMLPYAIYGRRSWQDALSVALAQGTPRPLGGGEVEGHRFLVAAILGAPALWAPAREAARHGKARLALRHAHQALRRAFTGRLRYVFDHGARGKAEALTFMCPRVSPVLDNADQALEAAALDLNGARDAFRLGFHALAGDWRDDPGVTDQPCRLAKVWASKSIPAILDGESVRLRSTAEVIWRPNVVKVLSIPDDVL